MSLRLRASEAVLIGAVEVSFPRGRRHFLRFGMLSAEAASPRACEARRPTNAEAR